MRILALIAAVLKHVTLEAIGVRGQLTFLADMTVEEKHLVFLSSRRLLRITDGSWLDSLTTEGESIVLPAKLTGQRNDCHTWLGHVIAPEDAIGAILARGVTGELTLLALSD